MKSKASLATSAIGLPDNRCNYINWSIIIEGNANYDHLPTHHHGCGDPASIAGEENHCKRVEPIHLLSRLAL